MENEVWKIFENYQNPQKSSTTRSELIKNEKKQKYSLTTDWESVLKEEEIPVAQVNTEDARSNRLHSGFIEFDMPMKTFCTGSKYEGSWNCMGFSGYGKYFFPHGPVYEGEFKEGLFHGPGQITYTSGDKQKILAATFNNGKLLEDTVSFQIGVKKLSHANMDYCTMPDRRFRIEYGLDPLPGVTKEYLTNAEIPKFLKENTYDVGNGYFDVKRNIIVEEENEEQQAKIIIPNKEKEDWIISHCRADKVLPVGHHPSLFEFWTAGRTRERLEGGFLSDEDINLESFVQGVSDLEVDKFTSTTTDEKGSGNSTSSKSTDNLTKAISNIKYLVHSVNDVCVQDSVSDHEAINYMDSIIDYIQKQYITYDNNCEEQITNEDDKNSIPSTFLDENIEKYLKKISSENHEEVFNPIKIKIADPVISDYDFPINLEDYDDDEPMSDVDFSLKDLDDDFDFFNQVEEGNNEDHESNEVQEEEEDI